MITENHQIAYQNVVSKYYNFRPDEIEAAITDFNQLLRENNCHPVGSLFYSLVHEPTDDGLMTAEVFLPVEESSFINKTDEQMYFRSYYNVRPMVMTRITKDFDSETQLRYAQLVYYMKQRGFTAKTPLFVEFKTNNSNDTYMELSIGV